jgi:hypothetical protein
MSELPLSPPARKFGSEALSLNSHCAWRPHVPDRRHRLVLDRFLMKFVEFALIVPEAKDLERGFFSRRIVDRYSYEAEFIAFGNAVEL